MSDEDDESPSLIETHARAELQRRAIRHMVSTGQMAAVRERAHRDAYFASLCRELGVDLGDTGLR